jgi:N-glycosylase/DNA lyase
MSLGKQDVVPVDTHIHSIAVTYYGQKKLQLNTTNYDIISSFFEQLWKPFAGWAQAVNFLLKTLRSNYLFLLLLGSIFQ